MNADADPELEHYAAGRTLPDVRLGAAVAAGAFWFGCGAIWAPLAWLGLVWWAAVVAAAVADHRMLRGAGRVTSRRLVEPVLSLGMPERVAVSVRNRSGQRFLGRACDEPPLDFVVDRSLLSFDLAPGQESVEVYHVTAPKRGDYSFGALTLRLTTGFRLLIRQLSFPLTGSVKVYPNLAGIRAHEVAARKERLVDLGMHPSWMKGPGLEFESLRAYLPGDELRRVDWKATARHAEPITREYDIERSQHLILCLDLGRTMASQLGLLSKADHAVNAATLLAYVGARSGDWVGLFAFAQQSVAFLPPRKHQFSRVLDALYGLQAEMTESNYYRSFLEAAHRIRKRSLVVLFTDLLDPDSSSRLLTYVSLLTRRHLVLCAALSDYELYERAARSPTQPRELYERTVATALLADRKRALSALRKRGAIAFDATPANLSVEALNHYLRIKAQIRL